jgi:hypothetical protein
MKRAGNAAPGAVVFALVAALAGAGCGASAEDVDAGPTFVAFPTDFKGFSTWKHVTFENGEALGLSHVAGPRTVYINREPPADATAFDVGTIIVKVTDLDGKIFARVKRGGTFNSKGAAGWEWFELLETAQHDILVKWRGVGPPLGETYGGDPNAGCNMCHKGAVASDYVLSPGLGVVPAPWDAAVAADASGDANTPADGGTDLELDAATQE